MTNKEAKTDNTIREKISGMVTLIILCVFPLFYDEYYFNILPTKYRFYYITMFVFFFFIIITTVCSIRKEFHAAAISELKKKILCNITLPDVAILLFMLIAIISTLTSKYRYESFWGNEGRYSGCFLMLIYGTSFLIISKTLKFKNRYIDLFLVAGMAVCLFGITDYFQLNILGFKDNMTSGQLNMFASTLGNINTYTAYVALVVAVSVVLFTAAKDILHLLLYYIATVISLSALIMGLSDNAYIALGALLALLPLYCLKTKVGLRRYSVLLFTVTLIIYAIDLINKLMPHQVLKMEGILSKLSGYENLEIVVLICFAMCTCLYIKDYFRKREQEDQMLGNTIRYIWGAILIFCFLLVVYVLYDANIAGNAERYNALSNYIVLNDDWGTHRGYNWRLAIENYKDFPIIHKIFGYGPDTYGIITHNFNFDEMVIKYNEIYDSAHNEYLQYFVTMGPIGLFSYILWIISSVAGMLRRGKENPYIIAIFFAVICYCVQATVNIALPISTPIMIMLLSIGVAGSKKTSK